MKTLLLTTFSLCLLMLSCSPSKEKKSQEMIQDYLSKTLNDPKSYESVSFSPIYYLKDTISQFQGRPDTTIYHHSFMMQHTYRGKNALGGVVTNTEYFKIDSAMTKVDCCFVLPSNHYN